MDISRNTPSGQQMMEHSNKLFAPRVPRLTHQQIRQIKTFAHNAQGKRYNYPGSVEMMPFMLTKQLCSLNPFSADFRQQCVAGLAKTQLGSVGNQEDKPYFYSEFVSEAFAQAGHPLALAETNWISPADLLHMRTGDVSTFQPEAKLQYVGHLKPGLYIRAGQSAGII